MKSSGLKLTSIIMPALVSMMLIGGFIMANFYKNSTIISIHKSIGVTILILTILKLCFDYIFKKPHISSRFTALLRFIFTVVIISMPLSGLLMVLLKGYSVNVFGLFTIPSLFTDKELASFFRQTHTILAIAIGSLIVLRILAFFGKKAKK